MNGKPFIRVASFIWIHCVLENSTCLSHFRTFWHIHLTDKIFLIWSLIQTLEMCIWNEDASWVERKSLVAKNIQEFFFNFHKNFWTGEGRFSQKTKIILKRSNLLDENEVESSFSSLGGEESNKLIENQAGSIRSKTIYILHPF